MSDQKYTLKEWQALATNVIPPLLMSAKSRGVINYSNFLGGTPPIAE